MIFFTVILMELDQLLSKVPYKDFMIAATDALEDLMQELHLDTRNVLLTFERIWSTVETDAIRSKPAAADWVIDRLPEKFHLVMKRAMSICKGEENERWDDIQELIKPCADFIIGQINHKMIEIELSNNIYKAIKLTDKTPVL